jgi:hypothetical protein
MKTILVNNTDLTRDKRFSFLTEDVVASGPTIRIQSIIGFESLGTSSGQILCIGEIGNERTEIIATSSTTGPSASYKEITLATGGLMFDHPQDTKVYIVDWNRIDFQWSATATGAKSTIIASPSYPLYIRPDQNETFLVDRSQTTGYYFSRFNETISSTNSDWSDPVPFGGFDDNTVFMIKKRAIDELGEQIDGVTITHEFLNQCLWEARREYHQSPGKRPFRRKFNFIMASSAFTGSYRIELPTDVERPWTAENIYGVKLGTSYDMTYYDKKQWDFDYLNVGHSTLASAYTVGNQDLYVTNVRDFTQPSGSVSVEGTTIGYSAIGLSGGTLRISTQGSWSASAGSDVWQNVTYGLPTRFTVWSDPGGSAYIYFNTPIDTAYIGENIYLDYYRTLVGFSSDSNILDEPSYDMFVYYLKAKIKDRRTKGSTDITQDSDFKQWIVKKEEQLSREVTGSNIRIRPGINHLPLPR